MFIRYCKKVEDYIECYYVKSKKSLSTNEINILEELISPNTGFPENHVEYGPYPSMVTPWCSCVLSILQKCGVHSIERVERSYLVPEKRFREDMVDPMTQMVYDKPLNFVDFMTHSIRDEPKYVNSIEEFGKVNQLGFDKFDLEYYGKLFKQLGRLPTDTELFDLAQSNSEHSRHWFFKGKLVKDGEELPQTLFSMVKGTNKGGNSKIAFSDNASAIEGFKVKTATPNFKTGLYSTKDKEYHLTFTAETHNFPTGVAPFPGAATGTGGRIRDGQSIGRGGLVIAGTVGYCVGPINEGDSEFWKKNRRTLIEASNGASDYGNKFGEPVICGFCRDFGQTVDGQRIEWVKPIMFTGGVGQMEDKDVKKKEPEEGMVIVKLGGPAYRIGVGGGAASSRDQNTKNRDADFDAVQRGDPQMENKLNRVIRSCTELPKNPILSIHDQGAGGTGNVTKEIVYPKGASIDISKVVVGDPTMGVTELWISEYQEQDTILINSKDLPLLERICERENLPMANIGEINSSGRIKVKGFDGEEIQYPVDLPLEPVVEPNEQKTYKLTPYKKYATDGSLTNNIVDSLINVFSLPSVGSKRFLTNKVDRSVTGLIAQQQCVGPLHTPLANCAVVAQSLFGVTGCVTAVGEQPIKGLLDTKSMAHMAVGEMLTNMMWCKISSIKDIRCSGNWMWPLKMDGEHDAIYEACKAMCEIVEELGFAFDGGKDSLSMVYKDKDETIMCPRSLVISGYAPCENVRVKVTPDIKKEGSVLLFVDLGLGKNRMGGSALYQSKGELGSKCPDVVDVKMLKNVFNTVQNLIANGKIVSGHDRSDGGLITTVCEMAFAGNFGITINLDGLSEDNIMKQLFSEELGVVLEVKPEDVEDVMLPFVKVPVYNIGTVTKSFNEKIVVTKGGLEVMNENMRDLRAKWEENSFELELEQCNPECVKLERQTINWFEPIQYASSWKLIKYDKKKEHCVAVIREEGSNGDREMAAAFVMAGFKVYDLCMNDLIKNPDLSRFRGVAFVGGFSYSDVLGAGTGWYQTIKSHPKLSKAFNDFYERDDTFSLGVCNGCQLMSKLGWIPGFKMKENISGRFESRFPAVKILNTKSIMLKGLKGSILGVWCANREGRFKLDRGGPPSPIVYVDSLQDGFSTHMYPHNPSGSNCGTAAVCSEDGRHLAMMPHPERSFLNWQFPHGQMQSDEKFSPWFGMFTEAYQWCNETSNK